MQISSKWMLYNILAWKQDSAVLPLNFYVVPVLKVVGTDTHKHQKQN